MFPQEHDSTLAKCVSGAELAQVMVKMLVHSAAPVLGSECSEKWMRMFSDLRLSTLMEEPYVTFKLLLLPHKIAPVGDD